MRIYYIIKIKDEGKKEMIMGRVDVIAEKSITAFTVSVSLFFFALFGILVLSLLFTSTSTEPYRLSSNNQKVIEKSLNSTNIHGQKKSVGDCVLEPTDYGWSCREVKSKKVFKIYNNEIWK